MRDLERGYRTCDVFVCCCLLLFVVVCCCLLLFVVVVVVVCCCCLLLLLLLFVVCYIICYVGFWVIPDIGQGSQLHFVSVCVWVIPFIG